MPGTFVIDGQATFALALVMSRGPQIPGRGGGRRRFRAADVRDLEDKLAAGAP